MQENGKVPGRVAKELVRRERILGEALDCHLFDRDQHGAVTQIVIVYYILKWETNARSDYRLPNISQESAPAEHFGLP